MLFVASETPSRCPWPGFLVSASYLLPILWCNTLPRSFEFDPQDSSPFLMGCKSGPPGANEPTTHPKTQAKGKHSVPMCLGEKRKKRVTVLSGLLRVTWMHRIEALNQKIFSVYVNYLPPSLRPPSFLPFFPSLSLPSLLPPSLPSSHLLSFLLSSLPPSLFIGNC